MDTPGFPPSVPIMVSNRKNLAFRSLSNLTNCGIGLFLIKRIDFRRYGLVWVVIVLTGMFDHYWLTLPQNMGLLGLVLGLSLK